MSLSKQDLAAGLKPDALGSPAYDPAVALRTLTGIAEGKTLLELSKLEGYPSRPTWYRWLAKYPDLKTAYDTARELSAQSFEDEMLDIARMLKEKNDFTAVRTTQLQTVLQQLRWSAARRNPALFGQKQDTTPAVAVQINTSLNLDGTGPGVGTKGDIYTITAEVPAVPRVTQGSEEQGDGGQGSGVEGDEPDTDPDTDGPFAAAVAPKVNRLHLKPTEPKRHPKHKTERGLRATLNARAAKAKRDADKGQADK